MACNPDLVQYIADQCADAGDISFKKMFGDYGIYCTGLLFGLVCDNCLYVKPTQAGREILPDVEMRPPYEGAKDYLYISDFDDKDLLSRLVKATCTDLLKTTKPKRRGL